MVLYYFRTANKTPTTVTKNNDGRNQIMRAMMIVSSVFCWFVLSLAFFIAPAGSFGFIAPKLITTTRKRKNRFNNVQLHQSLGMGVDLLQQADIETIDGPFNVSMFSASQCWGRQPLLIKKAFEAVESDPLLPAWQDIVQLASNGGKNNNDGSVTSRLIEHTPGELDSFTVEVGPFPQRKIRRRLDRVVSTLVVNDVDRWIPSVNDWMDENFDFLPRWRRDDAQISLAKIGGGIGPHVDNYDVFLIQTSGTREWVVGCTTVSVEEEYTNLVEESDVRILNITMPKSQTFNLEPGDCLYIPPRYVHCGTSTSDDCITLSVGCRAPSASELVSRVAEEISTSTSPFAVERYTDLGLFSCKTKDISPQVKDDMKRLVLEAVQEIVEDDNLFEELIGTIVTEPKRPADDHPIPLHALDAKSVKKLGIWADPNTTMEAIWNGTGTLFRTEGIAFASACKGRIHRLFAQGQMILEIRNSSLNSAALITRIANGRPMDREALLEMNITSPSSELAGYLKELLAGGFVYGSDDNGEEEDDDGDDYEEDDDDDDAKDEDDPKD